MEVKGQPKAMARPRRGRGGAFYSPSSPGVALFKQAARSARPGDEVMFPANVPVQVQINLYTRRPNSHFRGSMRWQLGLASLRFVFVSGGVCELDGMGALGFA